MAENELIVTAGLNFEASEALIVKQLETIQNNFNNKGGLQINCTINDAAIKQLQTNLESISKNLTIGIDSNTLQQSINQAVKSEPIKVNVEADIKSGELKRQAKEFKEMWKIGFTGESKENVKALNAQLREMLAEYDKAMKAQDQKGFEESWQKLTDFVNEYINTIRALTPEAEKLNSILSKTKVLIGYESTDYSNLEHAYGNQNKMTEILNESLGIGNWSYIKGKASYGFDSLVGELNSSLFKDADKISEHIVEGLGKIAAIRNSGQTAMAEWVKSEEEALSQDASYWAARKDAVLDSLYTIRNEVNPAKMEWTEILSDDDIQQGQEKIRAYTEVLEEGKRKIEALKIQIKAEGGDEIKAISSRFTGDAAGNLDGFVLAVQKSNGEVENLYHKLVEVEDETGKITREWSRTQITGSDKGVAKLQQDIARLQKELASFESSHKSIESGLTQPLEVARNALADLKNNVGSVETVQKALDNLKTVAANIGSNLKATGSSFNVFDNAANKAQNFDNTIKTLGIDIGKLAITDSKTGLVEQLELAKQRLADFKQIESEQGRGLEWSSRYAEISSLIQSITNNLKVAQKEDAVLNKELEHQQELREKIATEQQQQQHGYWQGRFEETIKAMTAENTVLKEMRQYYADMAKEAQQKENAFNREFERELKAEEKLEAEQQKRLATARELREEQQHNYWQGRFEDSVKGLTAENSILKEMRQYYEQLNKEAEKLNRTQSQDNNKALQEANKLIKDNLSALEKFNNSAIANNNKNNPLVASQTGLNSGYIAQLQGLQESLANDKSAENVARVKARLEELSNLLRDARFNSEALQQSLADGNAEAKFAAKLNQLKNQVEIFANTNRKATESLRLMRDGQTTFAQGWQNIRDALSNGNLDAAGLQRLIEQFRNFRGEADAVGLTVSRFFQSMQSQLRMVLQRWISLYAIIGYIRKMIDNVKELDNAMIDLRRVTEETDSGYERFLKNANELARTMKTTTSSLVEQAYQWSKLGYSINEALDLAQASTVFMKVADVNQDQALSNLVTTLKAFRIEAGQTMDVVDKLDKLNNRYAVSASGLGQGLERTASAMAMTGNSLEETLALLTGAGEITQNLENTGRILPLENYIG